MENPLLEKTGMRKASLPSKRYIVIPKNDNMFPIALVVPNRENWTYFLSEWLDDKWIFEERVNFYFRQTDKKSLSKF